MAKMEVDTDAINTLNRSMNSETENIVRLAQQMNQSIEALNSTWEGPNHDEFVAKFRDQYTELEEISRLLQKYCESLSKAHKLYCQCEDDVSRYCR